MDNTDYYYTNGFYIQFVTNKEKRNPVNNLFFSLKNSDVKLYAVTLIQDIYTPKNKFYIPAQLNGDRPFAAYILLGFVKAEFNSFNNIELISELKTGVLGPAAFGEETQNGIHSLLPTSAEVEGWENQINNSFMLNYFVEIKKFYHISKALIFSGFAETRLGLPFTNAGIGASVQIGLLNPLTKRYHFTDSDNFQIYFSFTCKGKIIGYNATLQGGLFTKSAYTLDKINRFIGYADIGGTIIYKSFNFEYIQHFNTPEFPDAFGHSWGSLLLSVKL